MGIIHFSYGKFNRGKLKYMS